MLPKSLSGKLGLGSFFVLGTVLGVEAEFNPAGPLAIFSWPGFLLSVLLFFLGIGPHGKREWLFLWTSPACNGLAYAGIWWLLSKMSN